MINHRTALGVVFTLALTVGCAKPAPMFRPLVLVQQSGLAIEGLTAEPLLTGATYTPTSYGPALIHTPRAQYTDMINMFKRFSQPVRVRVPGRDTPLYGLISFHELSGNATGPATRSYAITVPQSYVDQASNGRVSVVYELVPRRGGVEGRASAMTGGASLSGELLGWVLFLSDRPF